jgi:hypothetical protein
MNLLLHNTIWITIGEMNMREQGARASTDIESVSL